MPQPDQGHSLVLQCCDNGNVILGENGPTVHRIQACRRYESHLMTRMTCLASSCPPPHKKKILLVSKSVVWLGYRNAENLIKLQHEIMEIKMLLFSEAADVRWPWWRWWWRWCWCYWFHRIGSSMSLRLIKCGKEAQTKTGGKKNPEDKLQQESQTRCCTKISLHFHSLCLFLYPCQDGPLAHPHRRQQ